MTDDFPTLDEVIRRHTLAALRRCGGNKARAAELLGRCTKSLYNMLDRWEAEGLLDDDPAPQPGPRLADLDDAA